MTVNTFEPLISDKNELFYSKFLWKEDTIQGAELEKSSILVPVKLNGIDEELFMQLDLGANRTMIYNNTLSAFYEKHPDLKRDTIQKETYSILNNASIKINDFQILKANRLYVLKDFGQTKIDTNYILIGTLGYDILGNNVLILDFKTNQFAICEIVPNELQSKITYIKGADLEKFPIILPFKLGKRKIRLLYDTGASMFPIITGTNRLKRIAKRRKLEEVDSVCAWGKMIPIYKAKETKNKTGNLTIENIDLGKIEIYGEKRLNKLTYIGRYLYGITGNVVFDNKTLIIDRKNNSFGILE
jgi:hypothetical protein